MGKHQADAALARDNADTAQQSALQAQENADKIQAAADTLKKNTDAAAEDSARLREEVGRARNKALLCTSELQLATTMQGQCAQQLGECNEASLQRTALDDACALMTSQRADEIVVLVDNNARLMAMVKILAVVVVCLVLGIAIGPTLRRHTWKSYA